MPQCKTDRWRCTVVNWAGLLSGEHEYDIFLQNHAQIKVYGPSLTMTDNWEAHITQLGVTKSVHEYAVYQLLG